MIARGLGWHPDPPQPLSAPQDWDAGDLIGSELPPDQSSNRQDVLSILEQGTLNSCVANQGMQAIRARMHRQGVIAPALGSRLWGYYLGRAANNRQHNDSGMWCRAFFEACAKYGFPPEVAWPYEPAAVNTMPGPNAFRLAFDPRARADGKLSYHKLFSTGEDLILDLMRAIWKGYFPVFGARVGKAFISYDGSWLLEDPTDEPLDYEVGGHCFMAAEYDSQGVWCPNSYGVGHGAQGWAHLSWKYITKPTTTDFWVVEWVPTFPAAAE